MIDAILIDQKKTILQGVKKCIQEHCPQINLCGLASSYTEAQRLIQEHAPSLAFVDADVQASPGFPAFQQSFLSNLETIFLSASESFAIKAFQYQASGFLLKPVRVPELILAVQNVAERIEQKQKFKNELPKGNAVLTNKPPGNLIGIPTFEGFDFIPVEEIVRCEGMQKCTRIIIAEKDDLISSYNIGTFIKLLEPYQFFSTHKSHLINLIHIKKYYKEGSIKMMDNSCIPVSKRRKSLFLKRMLLSR